MVGILGQMGSHILVCGGGSLSLSRRYCRAVSGLEAAGGGGVRWQVLEQVDKELNKGDERAALNLVKDLQGKPDGLRCFGAARQIPQRLYTLDELRLNGIQTASLLSPVDTTLGSIERSIQAAAVLGGIAAWNFLEGYTLTSLDALKKEGSLNVQAGTAFVDFEFVEEVSKGKVSATTLNRFSCIALAGVATEYLLFGAAEGGVSDINTLDKLLKSLGFTQKKADAQVRWAVLNTVLILRRHEKARAMLAEAMSKGQSVGSCVDLIEKTIDMAEL